MSESDRPAVASRSREIPACTRTVRVAAIVAVRTRPGRVEIERLSVAAPGGWPARETLAARRVVVVPELSTPLGLVLPAPDARTRLRLDGKVKAAAGRSPAYDGRVSIEGWPVPSMRDSQLRTTLRDLDLVALQPCLLEAAGLELAFVLGGRLDDPRFSLSEDPAVRVAAGLAERLGVGLGDPARGVGGAGRRVIDAASGALRGLLGR
jgi:hypothetical protein